MGSFGFYIPKQASVSNGRFVLLVTGELLGGLCATREMLVSECSTATACTVEGRFPLCAVP